MMSKHMNDGKNLRVVHTRKNTTLEEWKVLVEQIAKESGVDLSKVTKLGYQHAWESEDTPISFVTIVKLINDRAARSSLMKKLKEEYPDQ